MFYNLKEKKDKGSETSFWDDMAGIALWSIVIASEITGLYQTQKELLDAFKRDSIADLDRLKQKPFLDALKEYRNEL